MAALIDQLHRACPHIHVLDNVWMEEYGKDVGEIAVNAERPDVYRSLIYGLTRFGTTLNQLEPIAV